MARRLIMDSAYGEQSTTDGHTHTPSIGRCMLPLCREYAAVQLRGVDRACAPFNLWSALIVIAIRFHPRINDRSQRPRHDPSAIIVSLSKQYHSRTDSIRSLDLALPMPSSFINLPLYIS